MIKPNIKINSELCTNCRYCKGICTTIYPEMFKVNSYAKVEINDEDIDLSYKKLKLAIECCPVKAIKLLDEQKLSGESILRVQKMSELQLPDNIKIDESKGAFKIKKNISIYDSTIVYKILNFYENGMTIQDISNFVLIKDNEVNNILDHILPYL